MDQRPRFILPIQFFATEETALSFLTDEKNKVLKNLIFAADLFIGHVHHAVTM
jgi:hypothetical protein